MSSKYHILSKSWFHRSHSAPSSSPSSTTPDSFRFRDQSSKTWSPKSDDSDPSFDSDEENIAMETDCHVKNKNWNGMKTLLQRPKFVLKTPLLSSVMATDARKKPSHSDSEYSLSGGSSKSLVVGRPVRALGLKDIDLTKNARAEEIRRAKAANRCKDNTHMLNPMSQYSTPSFVNLKLKEKSTPSSYHGNIYGINDVSDDDNDGAIPNTPPPEYSTLALPTALPHNTKKAPVNEIIILPYVNDDSKKTKASCPKIRRSNLILYSELIIDDTKCDEGFENKEKDVIEINDDDDIKATSSNEACDSRPTSYKKQTAE